MHIRITLKTVTHEGGWDVIVEAPDNSSPLMVGAEYVLNHNEVLPNREDPIELVTAKAEGERKHSWDTKERNKVNGSELFDVMRCGVCGVSGRRYGLSDNSIRIDPKYRHTLFKSCDTSLAHAESVNPPKVYVTPAVRRRRIV
jgi:hypothetical protein